MAKDKQMNEYEKAIFSLYFKLLDSSLSLKKKKKSGLITVLAIKYDLLLNSLTMVRIIFW